MGKHKKNKKKKSKEIQEAVPTDVLNVAVGSIRKFRKITNEIAKLSLGQKLMGGLVMTAAGLIYLNQRKSGSGNDSVGFNWPRLPEVEDATSSVAAVEEEPPVKVSAAPRKGRKSAKGGKSHGRAAQQAPADPAAAEEA